MRETITFDHHSQHAWLHFAIRLAIVLLLLFLILILSENVPGKTHPKEAFLWCNFVTAVRYGQPTDEILAYAREHEIDLICLGASGAGFSLDKLFGSTVDRVSAASAVSGTRVTANENYRQVDEGGAKIHCERERLLISYG